MTYWKVVSFETKLSERKYPLGSENSLIMVQNASSLNCAGRNSVATSGLDVKLSGPKNAMTAVALARMIRRRIGNIISTSGAIVHSRPSASSWQSLLHSRPCRTGFQHQESWSSQLWRGFSPRTAKTFLGELSFGASF